MMSESEFFPGDIVRVSRGCLAIFSGDPNDPKDFHQFGVVEDNQLLTVLNGMLELKGGMKTYPDFFINIICEDGRIGWIRPGVTRL